MLQGVALKREAIYTTATGVSDLIASGQEWNFHDADTSEHLHSLHPYPAKFIPQIPRKAIQQWSRPGGLVVDPFCGCGTTLLEASLLDRQSIGIDNNAVACLISRAKTAVFTPKMLREAQRFASDLRDELAKAKPVKALIPDTANFRYWFSDEVLERLSAIKALAMRQPEPLQTLLLTVFSSLIVRVSYQDSDTRYAKVDRAVDPSEVDRVFHTKTVSMVARLPDIMTKSRASVSVHQADSRKLTFIKSGGVDLIVTSPPYLNAYDYHKYHRQRLHWIDGDIAFARDLEIGKHDDFTRPRATPDQYFVDMGQCFSEWSRILKRGGKCLVVIGDAIVTKQPVFVADTFVQLMRERDLTLEKRWIRELHATSRAFNVRNSRMSHEHVLLFQKEGRASASCK